MSNQVEKNLNDEKKFDLYERTSKFGEDIIRFAQEIPNTSIDNPLVSQLVRAGTSVGGNYMEADCAESKKDFVHKLGICKKESKETTHWLRMIAIANPRFLERCRSFWKEARELTLILSSIIEKTKKKL